jgi:Uma2 family endonuclease
MTLQTSITTLEQFEQFISLPENASRHFELIDGEIHEKMSASFLPSMIAANILWLLKNHVVEHELGYITGADGSYVVSPKDHFMPDVGFIRKERLPEIPSGSVPVAPDLAVEVVSPSDSIREVHKKALRYLAKGTQMVWVVYPEEQVIEVYRPSLGDDDARIQSLGIEEAIDGGDSLPGLVLPLSKIFQA